MFDLLGKRGFSMTDHERKLVVSIEDDADFTHLLRLMLRGEDVEVVHAGDGKVGLNMVGELIPDLVLLDLTMPKMNGWQVFEEMQGRKNLRDIPVIVVTAQSSEIDRSFGLDVAGVDAYLIKPVRAAEFRSTVAQVLSDSHN
jgi:DNA-binding response OmpR family regulator